MKDFAGSTYIEHAKYYEDEYAKHHQKQQDQVKRKPHQKQGQHDIASHKPSPQWSTDSHGAALEPPLSNKELEYFFWNTLVPLGWRKNDIGSSETYQLMLVCTECDNAVLSQQSHTITMSKAKKMSSASYVAAEIVKHLSKCKPFKYDEEGNVIEAISEATPEATSDIFERPQTGTVRFDTVNGCTMLFDGERWVEHEL